jgi:hypothetical protein
MFRKTNIAGKSRKNPLTSDTILPLSVRTDIKESKAETINSPLSIHTSAPINKHLDYKETHAPAVYQCLPVELLILPDEMYWY